MALNPQVIVVDNGTYSIKCGRLRHMTLPCPDAIFRTVIGRPLHSTDEELGTMPEFFVGDEAMEYSTKLTLSHPIFKSYINDWGDMCHVWEYMLENKLRVTPKYARIVLTEPMLNPINKRQKMVETMFERFKFDGIYIAPQPTLALYAQGLLTGVSVDIGDSTTTIMPIYESVPLSNVPTIDISGQDVTNHLTKLLMLRGYPFQRAADQEIVRQIKEKLCYCSHNPLEEDELSYGTITNLAKFALPDGRVIKADKERYWAAEVLFQPSLMEKDCPGIAAKLFNSLCAAPSDVQFSLSQHIVLSGGSSMLPGVESRLEQDFSNLCEKNCKRFRTVVESASYRRNQIFIGGRVLAEIMADRDGFFVLKNQYDEQGSRCITSQYKLGA
ncbi:actin family [Pelomyxa schiedti]|nr:actin family [Pelomyxa schiedti]